MAVKKKLVIGSDHRGFELKKYIITYLEKQGYEVLDVGCFSSEQVDYTDIVESFVKQTLELPKNQIYGVLICGTGIGVSMAVNRFKHIRASLVHDTKEAILTREHNDSNVLCLSASKQNSSTVNDILESYLNTEFLAGRHVKRVNKLSCMSDCCSVK